MPRDANEGRGRWKAAKSRKSATTSKQARKWTAVGILGILLGAASLGALYLILISIGWFRPEIRYVPFWIGRFKNPSPRIAPISWIDADRRAIREGGYFSRFDESDFNDPPLEKITPGLATLGTLKSGEAVVIHVSGSAVVSQANAEKKGEIRILASESDPTRPNTMLPLGELLAEFANCPSKKKLLILDIMKSRLDLADLGGMSTADGVTDLIKGEIERLGGGQGNPESKPPGLILLACGEGENSVDIDSLGGSLFNRYLRAGLRDSDADADRNGAIMVSELAAYLGKMVGTDAYRYRGLRQVPLLLGRGDDFALASVGSGQKEVFATPAEPLLKEKSGAPAEKGKDVEPSKEATNAKEESKERPRADEKKPPAVKEGSSEASQDPRGYPSWLAASWAEREAIWKDGDWIDCPRLCRTLDSLLLRVERRWRGGENPKDLEAETRKAVDEIRQAAAKDLETRERSRPRPRSLGQAKLSVWNPDEGLIGELKAVLHRRRTPDLTLKPEQRSEALAAAVKAFLVKLKNKTSIDLAGAVVGALDSTEERFDAESIKFVSSVVDQAIKADPALELDLIELRFLNLLARRAAAASIEPWSDDTAKTAWQVVVEAERANFRPRSFPWTRAMLEEADSLRHVAEIRTLPATARYASWKVVGKSWEEVQLLYASISSSQEKIEEAQRVLAQARRFLPSLIPFLESSDQPELERHWLEAADLTRKLGDLLVPPSSGLSRQSLAQVCEGMSGIYQELVGLLRTLGEPFSEDSLQGMARTSVDEKADPDAGLAFKMESILSTSVPNAPQRELLWQAIRKLDARLEKRRISELPVENELTRARLRKTVADARARRLSALVALAGHTEIEGVRPLNSEPVLEAATAADAWNLLASQLASTREQLKKRLGQSEGDDIGALWFAPVDDLHWKEHPVREGTEYRNRGNDDWLASRYRHEREDSRDEAERRFYDRAAGEVARSGDGTPELYPELAFVPGSESREFSLAANHPREDVRFRVTLRANADSGIRKVAIKVLPPDDDRLKVALEGSGELALTPQSSKNVIARVEWSESGIRPVGPSAAPNGFLIQATMENGRSYHLPVPLAIVPRSEQLELALSSVPDRLAEIPFDLRLRALSTRQSFYVFVKNPSSAPRNVLVEILEDGSVIPGTEAKPLMVAAKGVAKVPAFGPMPLPKTESLHDLPESSQLQIRLKDVGTGEILRSQRLAVGIASPDEYLEIDAAGTHFNPTRPNRLEVKFRARPAMTGPAAALAMTLENRWIPGLKGAPRELKLEGSLEPGGAETLYAGGISLDPAEKTLGRFPVDVDGFKRALWFETRFEQSGVSQRAELLNDPRVFFGVSTIRKTGAPTMLRVTFQVDDAPAGASLRWQLGQVQDGKYVEDRHFEEKSAKNRRIGFDARGAGGALLFEASSKDWDPEINVSTIQGERSLQAKLLGPDGRQLAEYTVVKVFDDAPPGDIALGLPKSVKPKALMPVTASLRPPVSGLKEVAFYFGKEEDFKKAQTDGRLVKGKQKAGETGTYEARLPIPETANGAIEVSVRALSNEDLAGFATSEVEIAIPTPAPDPTEEAAAKAAMPKVGAISGKVTARDRPQDGLDVFLYLIPKKDAADKNPMVVNKTKTDKMGSYTFQDLEPGTYAVYCKRDALMSEATKQTAVKAGDTITLDLDLMLR